MCLSESVDLPQRNSHFSLWPILFLVVCIVDIKLCKLFICFGDESLVSILANILTIILVFPWGFALGMQMLLRLIQSHFVIYGLFFIKSWIHKELAVFYVVVSCLYFLKNFIVSIITFRYLYSLGLILCLVLGCFLISFSFSWLKESWQCPPEWLLPIYILSISGGGFPCLHTLSSIYCL